MVFNYQPKQETAYILKSLGTDFIQKIYRNPNSPKVTSFDKIMTDAVPQLTQSADERFYGKGLSMITGSEVGVSLKRNDSQRVINYGDGFLELINLGYWVRDVMKSRYCGARVLDFFTYTGAVDGTIEKRDVFYGSVFSATTSRTAGLREYLTMYKNKSPDNGVDSVIGYLSVLALNMAVRSGDPVFKGLQTQDESAKITIDPDLYACLSAVVSMYDTTLSHASLESFITVVIKLIACVNAIVDSSFMDDDKQLVSYQARSFSDQTVSGMVIRTIIGFIRNDSYLACAGRQAIKPKEFLPYEKVSIRALLHDDDALDAIFFAEISENNLKALLAEEPNVFQVTKEWEVKGSSSTDKGKSGPMLSDVPYKKLINFCLRGWLNDSESYKSKLATVKAFREQMKKNRAIAMLSESQIANMPIPASLKKRDNSIKGWFLGAKIMNNSREPVDPVFGQTETEAYSNPITFSATGQDFINFNKIATEFANVVPEWNDFVDKYFTVDGTVLGMNVATRSYLNGNDKVYYFFSFTKPHKHTEYVYDGKFRFVPSKEKPIMDKNTSTGGIKFFNEDGFASELIGIDPKPVLALTLEHDRHANICDGTLPTPPLTYHHRAITGKRTFCFDGYCTLTDDDMDRWQEQFYRCDIISQEDKALTFVFAPSCRGYLLKGGSLSNMQESAIGVDGQSHNYHVYLMVEGSKYVNIDPHASATMQSNMFLVYDPFKLAMSIRENEYGTGEPMELEKQFESRAIRLIQGSYTDELPDALRKDPVVFYIRRIGVFGGTSIFTPYKNEICHRVVEKNILAVDMKSAPKMKDRIRTNFIVSRFIKICIPYDLDNLPSSYKKAAHKQGSNWYPVNEQESVGKKEIFIYDDKKKTYVKQAVQRITITDTPFPGYVGTRKSIVTAELYIDLVDDVNFSDNFTGFHNSDQIVLHFNELLPGLTSAGEGSFIGSFFTPSLIGNELDKSRSKTLMDYIGFATWSYKLGADVFTAMSAYYNYLAAVADGTLTPDNEHCNYIGGFANSTVKFIVKYCQCATAAEVTGDWAEAGGPTGATWAEVLFALQTAINELSAKTDESKKAVTITKTNCEKVYKAWKSVMLPGYSREKDFYEYLLLVDTTSFEYNWDWLWDLYYNMIPLPNRLPNFVQSVNLKLQIPSDLSDTFDYCDKFCVHAIQNLLGSVECSILKATNQNDYDEKNLTEINSI